MLSVNHLGVAFRRYAGLVRRTRIICLHDVSLCAKPGEVLAVVGASGAGKSLLAHAILGILPRTAEVVGHMSFAGEPLTAARQAALRGHHVALVPQSIAHLDPLARSEQQVRRAAIRGGVASTSALATARAAAQRFGLEQEALSALPHALSGGMARRVMLAIATCASAKLIIADEPTNGLDATNSAVVFSYLRGVADQGRMVVLITHDLLAALTVADRVMVMRDGVTQGVAAAADFSGDGAQLHLGYLRDLWRALPQNDFVAPAG